MPRLVHKHDDRWIAKDAAKICTLCKSKFGMTRLRHHCRMCGKIYCAKCCEPTNLGFRSCANCKIIPVENFEDFYGHTLRHRSANVRQQLEAGLVTMKELVQHLKSSFEHTKKVSEEALKQAAGAASRQRAVLQRDSMQLHVAAVEAAQAMATAAAQSQLAFADQVLAEVVEPLRASHSDLEPQRVALNHQEEKHSSKVDHAISNVKKHREICYKHWAHLQELHGQMQRENEHAKAKKVFSKATDKTQKDFRKLETLVAEVQALQTGYFQGALCTYVASVEKLEVERQEITRACLVRLSELQIESLASLQQLATSIETKVASMDVYKDMHTAAEALVSQHGAQTPPPQMNPCLPCTSKELAGSGLVALLEAPFDPSASEDPPAYNAIARRPSLMQATFRGSRTSLLRGSDKGSKSHLGDLTADVIKDKLETAQEQEEEEGEVVDQADGEPASPSAEVEAVQPDSAEPEDVKPVLEHSESVAAASCPSVAIPDAVQELLEAGVREGAGDESSDLSDD